MQQITDTGPVVLEQVRVPLGGREVGRDGGVILRRQSVEIGTELEKLVVSRHDPGLAAARVADDARQVEGRQREQRHVLVAVVDVLPDARDRAVQAADDPEKDDGDPHLRRPQVLIDRLA